MNLYLIVKKGIYRHDIKGAFSTLLKAVEVATLETKNDMNPFFTEEEPDHHHNFQVLKLIMDKDVNDGTLVCTATWNETQKRVDILFEEGEERDEEGPF